MYKCRIESVKKNFHVHYVLILNKDRDSKNQIWVIFLWGNGYPNDVNTMTPFLSEKNIVWILGFMVFKSTGSNSLFQCQKRFWKKKQGIPRYRPKCVKFCWFDLEGLLYTIFWQYFSKPIFALKPWVQDGDLNTMNLLSIYTYTTFLTVGNIILNFLRFSLCLDFKSVSNLFCLMSKTILGLKEVVCPQGPPYKVNEEVVYRTPSCYLEVGPWTSIEMELTYQKLGPNLKNWMRFWYLKIWQNWDFASTWLTKIPETHSNLEIEGLFLRVQKFIFCNLSSPTDFWRLDRVYTFICHVWEIFCPNF